MFDPNSYVGRYITLSTMDTQLDEVQAVIDEARTVLPDDRAFHAQLDLKQQQVNANRAMIKDLMKELASRL